MVQKRDTCCVFTTVSGKGGAGKSTVSCMLGVAFARQGYRTLLIDADEGLRCLDLMLGVSEDVVFDLGDLIHGRCEAKDALRPIPGVKDLYLIPAPRSAGQIGDGLADLISALRGKFDRILVDSSAGIGAGFSAAAAVSDEILAVVGCDPVSLRDARNVCDCLRDLTGARRRMILNRFDRSGANRTLIPHIDTMIDTAAMQLVGVVPFDPALALGAMRGKPVTKGHGWRAFVRIANRLEGKTVRLPRLSSL